MEKITPQDFFTWVFFASVLFIFLQYNWNRRWLYYYGSKLQGPSSWPIIGSTLHFITGEGFHEALMKMSEKYPSVFRIWAGAELLIVNSNPEDLEFLLNRYLQKAPLYDVLNIVLKRGLLTGYVNTWKMHRKIIAHTFNPKVLNTFCTAFNKHTKKLADNLKVCCKENQVEVFPLVWKCTVNMACETLLDVDASSISGQDKFISRLIRIEEEGIRWMFIAPIFPKYLWKFTTILHHLSRISSLVFGFTQRVINLKIGELSMDTEKYDDDDVKIKRFLNHLIMFKNKNKYFTDKKMLAEVQTMLITGSESTAILLTFVLTALALHKDVQDKVYEELSTIFDGTERDVTPEDLSKMEYTERVIKETMRLLPPASVIGRYIDEDIKLGDVLYPKGSCVVVPITYLHRKPELWDDPLSFNPDRFLPENFKNRHRCSYIPFSFGPRNCIGFNYGMMSMKVMVAAVLRRYEVLSVNQQSIKDMELKFRIIIKPTKECKIVLRKRTVNTE